MAWRGQISAAPVGTQACTLDIEKFHRTIPVIPSHKCWLVLQDNDGRLYIDHCAPFGSASASSNAGMVANAGVDICHAKGIGPILKYEDDLKCLRIPSPSGSILDAGRHYLTGPDDIKGALTRLGFPIHKEKGDGVFRSTTTFIGFSWDIDRKLVSLPEKKRLKFERRVADFRDLVKGRGTCTRKDLERIHGSLCHVAFVVSRGRSYLPSLTNLMSDFSSRSRPTARLHATTAVQQSLAWWSSALSSICEPRSIMNRGPPCDMGLFVDASTSFGVGIYIDGRWSILRLRDSWNEDGGRGICWLETVAVEILVIYLDELLGLRDRHILIHSDNQGTIGSLSKGKSRNFHVNHSVRRCFDIAVPTGLSISLEYVASAENPADSLSRGLFGPIDKKLPPCRLPHDIGRAMFFI